MATRKNRKTMRRKTDRRKSARRKSRRGGIFRMFRRGNSSSDKQFIEENYSAFNISDIEARKIAFELKDNFDWKYDLIIARGNRIYFGNLTKNDDQYYLQITDNNKYYNKHLMLTDTDIIYVAKDLKMKDIDKLRKIVSNRSPSKINDVYYEYITSTPYFANNARNIVGEREMPDNNAVTTTSNNEEAEFEIENNNYLTRLMKRNIDRDLQQELEVHKSAGNYSKYVR